MTQIVEDRPCLPLALSLAEPISGDESDLAQVNEAFETIARLYDEDSQTVPDVLGELDRNPQLKPYLPQAELYTYTHVVFFDWLDDIYG